MQSNNVYLIIVDGGVTGLTITNNYIENITGMTQYSYSSIHSSVSSSSLLVKNNVLLGAVTLKNSTFHNNILRNGTFTRTNTSYYNNIGNSTQFGTSNGNQSSVDINTVFVATGSSDGQWQLATDSPAIGAATDGGDVGMFGGNDSYVLSGLPSIPAIHYFDSSVSGSVASGLQVNIKIKSHN